MFKYRLDDGEKKTSFSEALFWRSLFFVANLANTGVLSRLRRSRALVAVLEREIERWGKKTKYLYRFCRGPWFSGKLVPA